MSNSYKNFKDLYENRFPSDLKADFEKFLTESLSGKRYSENTKHLIASAFVSGYTAAMKRDIDTRRKRLAAFDEHIEKLEVSNFDEKAANHASIAD
jgi:hypothetical protein